MPPYPLISFEMQRYYQKESRFTGAFSRNKLLKVRDVEYKINLCTRMVIIQRNLIASELKKFQKDLKKSWK